jgi:hypothetical protein
MFASLERNLLSNTNMLNLNVSILDCTPHTAKPYVKMYLQTHKKHLHPKNNVSIIKSHSNVETEYVCVTLTQIGFQHLHVKSQCIKSLLHSIHYKTICEDVTPNKQKTLTCEKTMFASWFRIQMSKHNMFDTHWRNIPSNTNMWNVNVSIMESSPYIAKPFMQMWPHFQDKCIQTITQCLHHKTNCEDVSHILQSTLTYKITMF